jgi:hypothetical protein
VVSFMNEKKYTLIRVYFEVGTVNEGAFYVWEFHFQFKQKESYNKNRQGEKMWYNPSEVLRSIQNVLIRV